MGKARFRSFPTKRLRRKKMPPSSRNYKPPLSRAVDVVAESRLTTDVDAGFSHASRLHVGDDPAKMARPAYLAGYECWEHVIGHHDELTDVFSLGLLLASVACGLDFTDPTEMELFAANRSNLFALNRQLNRW